MACNGQNLGLRNVRHILERENTIEGMVKQEFNLYARYRGAVTKTRLVENAVIRVFPQEITPRTSSKAEMDQEEKTTARRLIMRRGNWMADKRRSKDSLFIFSPMLR
jgi:hypothetical protein